MLRKQLVAAIGKEAGPDVGNGFNHPLLPSRPFCFLVFGEFYYMDRVFCFPGLGGWDRLYPKLVAKTPGALRKCPDDWLFWSLGFNLSMSSVLIVTHLFSVSHAKPAHSNTTR